MKNKQRLTFEFLSIVVAVVLAMGLTEWRQNALNKKQAEVSFQNILKEIDKNFEDLVADSADIAEDLMEIGKWIATDRNYRDTLDFSVNFALSFLNSSAWEVAKLNQSLTFLDQKKVQDISEIYLAQQFLDKMGITVFSQMKNLVKVDEKNIAPYEEEMRAFNFDMKLMYGSVAAYLNVSRKVLKSYPIPSDLEVQ